MKRNNRILIAAAVFFLISALLGFLPSDGTDLDAVQQIGANLPDPPDSTPVNSAGLSVHFIDVGQGDAALILCNDATMLIDGGEPDQSSKVYSYLKEQGVRHLDYIVATHAHSDHVGGLSGALSYATTDCALCPVDQYDSKAFNSFIKYLAKQEVNITVPQPGQSFSLGDAIFTVLSPLDRDNYENENDTSLVLKLVYGETSFLFTGDAGQTAESDLLKSGNKLSATLLKVGHHGSNAGSSHEFLRQVSPEYAVISAGADNPYGHPDQDTLARLKDAGAKIYRTDLQGTIVCSSNGKTLSFTVEKDVVVPESPEAIAVNGTIPANPDGYIGNLNSQKFHSPSCKSLPAEKNRLYFDSRQEALDAGYTPCGNCHP